MDSHAATMSNIQSSTFYCITNSHVGPVTWSKRLCKPARCWYGIMFESVCAEMYDDSLPLNTSTDSLPGDDTLNML